MPDAPLGSRDNPILAYNVKTKTFMLECKDPLHDIPGGRWFYANFPKTSRCRACCVARPVEWKRKAKPKPGQPNVDAAVRFIRRHLAGRKSEAAKLSDDEQVRHFGNYGKIKCSERHARLAQLDVYREEEDDLHDPYTPVLAILTGVSERDIIAMRAGEPPQSRYPEMRAYYQIQDTTRTLASRIKRTQRSLQAMASMSLSTVEMFRDEIADDLKRGGVVGPAADKVNIVMRDLVDWAKNNMVGLDPKKWADIDARISDTELKLLAQQPDPPKQPELNFGEHERGTSEQMAADMVTAMLMTVPPIGDDVLGGPGPLR